MSDWKRIAQDAWNHPGWKKAAIEYGAEHPPDPRITGTFEEMCRKADELAARTGNSDLPEGWETMDVPALWEALNDPARWTAKSGGDAPQSVYDSIVWSLIHNRGWEDKARRQNNIDRLTQLSDRQVRALVAALRRKDCDPGLIADIEGFL